MVALRSRIGDPGDVSDKGDARGAPRAPAKPPPIPPKPGAAAPTPAFRPRAPSAPQITPPPPATPKQAVAIEALDDSDLVDSGGWDTAETVTSLPKEQPKLAASAPAPIVPTPLPTPRPTPKSPAQKTAPAGAAPGLRAPTPIPTPTPTPTPTPLPTPTPRQPVVKKDESVGSVVRAAVEEAVTPHIEKSHHLEAQNRELLAKIEALQGQVVQAKQEVEIIKKASQVPQVPVVVSTSVAPGAAASVAPPPRPSMHSTSYGPVITLPPGAPRPGELDLSNVGPIDLPDFGQRKRIVGRIVVVLMLGLVVAAFVAMIVSRA
jgi:hypothetical protein